VRLCALAARYSTPAFILDEADVRCRCRSYTAALPGAKVAPAGKAFLCRARARWIAAAGVADRQFGFSLSSGAAADAVREVLAHPELDLIGLHCHLGSQLTEVPAYEAAASCWGLMALVRARYGVVLGNSTWAAARRPLCRWRRRVRPGRLREPHAPGDCQRVHPAPAAGVVPGHRAGPSSSRCPAPACNHSMASSYNLVGLPPVIAVPGGTPRPWSAETTSNPLVRDIGL
jgi:Pyridoxal-dependent decarboxylase, pyridoxal binding domain